ncbi:hypothetical protein AA313_de0204549 [Arthrobotrys entomopaga]|nr:hypothetical protein AA313_de0204549 [Arthrobotrys entomopaga]
MAPQQDQSIIDIFNTLPSPSPTLESHNPFHAEILQTLLDESEHFPGLRTKPFKYQRRSAALMFQREQGIRYRECEVLTKKTTPATTIPGDSRRKSEGRSIHQHDEDDVFYDSRIGGILAEEMGSGKTLICLLLILASKYLKVEMPGHTIHRPPTVDLTEDGNNKNEDDTTGIPSLLTLSIRAIMTQGVPWKDRIPDYHERLSSLIHKQHISHKWDSYQITRATSSRLAKKDVTDVYLSSATIVVVPGNLMIQWEDEILKHTLPPEQGGLKYAKVMDRGPIPTTEELLGLDVLLISRTRFDKEIQDGQDGLGRRRHAGVAMKCSCDLKNSRSKERNCVCPTEEGYYSSPLMTVHFKRIIVDEGHSMASSKSNSVLVADKLHVNSKWAVTGTPSSGLYSRNVTAGEDEGEGEGEEEVDNSIKVSEASDLRRIGDLITHFLKLPPYDTKKVRWPNKVHEALSTGLLRSVLERVMIRHRISDIETEVSLPPLHQKFVYVKPGFYEKLTLNLFLAQLATNEVTSERCDQDWLFHHTQRRHLNDFVNNMRECAFFWTGLNRKSVVEMRDNAVKYLVGEKVKSEADRELLRSVVRTAQMALGSRLWETLSVFHEMGYSIKCLPETVRQAWAMDPAVAFSVQEALLGGAQMMTMQKLVSKNAYSGKDMSAALTLEGDFSMPAHRELTAARDDIIGRKETGQITEAQYDLLLKQNKAPQRSLQSKQTKHKKSPKKSSPSKLRRNSNSGSGSGILKKGKKVSQDEYFPADSPLRDTTVTGVVSAKLAYLLSKVLELQKDEKILIFYETDQVAFYIAEALSVVGVNYLLYSKTGLDIHRKAEYLVTFNTTEIFRVFLLDVSQAAQGIHLGSASRVFFVNPIWQPPSVLAQAMKRAHRIGQTKPVYVETLILKDTIEETIFNRKNQMNENDFRGKKLMVDDEGLRNLLTKEPFVDIAGAGEVEVGEEEMFARLEVPQGIFGEGKIGDSPEHPDLDIVTLKRESVPTSRAGTPAVATTMELENVQVKKEKEKKAKKRVGFAAMEDEDDDAEDTPVRSVRFAADDVPADGVARRISLFGGKNGFFEDIPASSEASTTVAMQLSDSSLALPKRMHECGEEQEPIAFKRVKFVDAEV